MKRGDDLSKNYTFNQTMAIGLAFAISTWALTAYATTMMLGIAFSLYLPFVILGWVLIPFYLKLVRQAFIVGILLTAIGFSYLLVTPSLSGTATWYSFERGFYDLTYVIFCLIAIAGIYFYFKSWKELLT